MAQLPSPKTRVPDPIEMSVRQNGPADGWLTDGANRIPTSAFGDYPDHSGISQTSWWVGPDSGYGNVGPGSWSGAPASPAAYGLDYGHQGVSPWFGPSDESIGVLPGITRCLTVLVEPIIRTLWNYRRGDEYLPRPLWVDDPQLVGRAPGPVGGLLPAGRRMGGHSFFSSVLASAILWGRGAWVHIEAADGTPLPGSLVMLNPFLVDVDADGRFVLDPGGRYPLTTDHDGRFRMNGDTWRVVVVRGLPPNDGVMPEGVLLRHWETLRTGARLQRYVGSTFLSGVPSGYLTITTPNADEKVVSDLRDSWARAHGKGARQTAVLNSSVSYTPIALSPLDAAAESMVRVSRTDLAHAFGLSSIWLDEGASGLAYNNATDRRKDLVSMSLAGWGERMVAAITSCLPYGTRCEVNWSSFTAPNFESLVPILVQAVQAGLMTAAEARQRMDLAPNTGPDPSWSDHSPAVLGFPKENPS